MTAALQKQRELDNPVIYMHLEPFVRDHEARLFSQDRAPWCGGCELAV